MDNGNLLAFGCVVTFIAVAGAYTVLLQSFVASERAEPAGAKAKPAHDVVRRPLATRDERR
ncbi:MAG: hypothetical protein EXR91_08085 [Gemmatimonadetes bacterium]|nr:hypothetical protein [Gemmatimonadota bacterium]